MRKVTCPACRKDHQINLNHCPHCQTTVTDELNHVRSEIMKQDEEQGIAKKARNTKRWKWGLGIAAGLAVLGQMLPDEADNEYTVPAERSNAQKVVAACEAMQVAWEADDLDRVKLLIDQNRSVIVAVTKGGDHIDDPATRRAIPFAAKVIMAHGKLNDGNKLGWATDTIEAIHTCANDKETDRR